jgi:hypothetical protein
VIGRRAWAVVLVALAICAALGATSYGYYIQNHVPACIALAPSPRASIDPLLLQKMEKMIAARRQDDPGYEPPEFTPTPNSRPTIGAQTWGVRFAPECRSFVVVACLGIAAVILTVGAVGLWVRR